MIPASAANSVARNVNFKLLKIRTPGVRWTAIHVTSIAVLFGIDLRRDVVEMLQECFCDGRAKTGENWRNAGVPGSHLERLMGYVTLHFAEVAQLWH